MSLIKVLHAQEPEVDLTGTYDAIVIGSGAAGGMAAHVLTSQGLKVLLLEAGRKLDIDKELKSMEWPYEHPRRGAMPPDREALTMNEYTIRQPPYGALSKFNKVHSNIQSWNAADYSKNIVVDEKDTPIEGASGKAASSLAHSLKKPRPSKAVRSIALGSIAVSSISSARSGIGSIALIAARRCRRAAARNRRCCSRRPAR